MPNVLYVSSKNNVFVLLFCRIYGSVITGYTKVFHHYIFYRHFYLRRYLFM